MLGEDNPVRRSDVFAMGWISAKALLRRRAPLANGSAGLPPAPLLKIYIYGYFNRVASETDA